MALLVARLAWNPDPAVTRNVGASAIPVDVDAINLSLPYVVPASERVMVTLNGYTWSGGTAGDGIITYWNLREDLLDLIAKQRIHNTINPTRHHFSRILTGLDAGAPRTVKWGAQSSSLVTGVNLQAGTNIGPAIMEVWDAPADRLLDFRQYEPDPAVIFANNNTSGTAPVDIDAANLAVTFDYPASGRVMVEFEGLAQTRQRWCVREGAAVVAPFPINFERQVVSEANRVRVNIRMMFVGAPGSTHTYKWGWSVAETPPINLYAGTDFGAAAMRVWRVDV